MVIEPDSFGRYWPNVPNNERCDICGQPDNCGDCNHEPMSNEQVRTLT